MRQRRVGTWRGILKGDGPRGLDEGLYAEVEREVGRVGGRRGEVVEPAHGRLRGVVGGLGEDGGVVFLDELRGVVNAAGQDERPDL